MRHRPSLSRVCCVGHFETARFAFFSTFFIAALVVSQLLATGLAAEVQFNRDVRPILADNCFSCHGADSASREADLRLDVREAAIESGSIAEGEPDESEMIARIFSDDPDLLMPPPETKKTLNANQKALLRQWIADGAEYEPHWSFIAPQRADLHPSNDSDWIKNPIDHFVLARLREVGLSPAAEVEPAALFRRLHLDLTGLPPSLKNTAAFVSDYAKRKDGALSDWIDRLMDSPTWGEHRARYWLDAARYGDTHGLHFDNYREMWPYRDWVIRAFNANLPFDQFIVEQLAGDLLPNPTDDQLIATGFQRCNITTNEGGTIDEENLANYAVDRVQTFGWVFLGLTTNCAQCHNHKFDPLTMKDYYSLAAYFRNTTQGAKDGNSKDGKGPILVVPSRKDRPRWNALPGEIADAQAKRDKRKQEARGDFEQWLASHTPDSIISDVPEEGLLIHAMLNEGSGNRVAINPSKSDFVQASGEIDWSITGKLGSAPLLKREANLELADSGDFEKGQEFSYGAWIRPARENASAAVIARMDEDSAFRGWDLWQNGRSISVHIVDSWPNNAIKVSTQRDVVKAGEWLHVFVTYDGTAKPSGVKIFINGKEEKLRVDTNSLKADASIRTETPLRIGQRSKGSVFEGGSLQDLRIYNVALDSDQVGRIANRVQLREILGTEPEDRSEDQQATIFEYYLTTVDADYPRLVDAVANLEQERDAIRNRSPITHIQQEKADSVPMADILMRGAYDKPGEKVIAGTPAALHAMPTKAPNNRLGLAQWVVDPANSLTSRVTVNRFWQELFGRGIVETPEDFGVMGADPSHPELLDWLAIEFRESGWDVKAFFKLMLMSATYRQAATTTPQKLELDRDNRLLSRGARFRMDGEMVRDYALSVSGLLSDKMFGPSVKPYQPEGIWDVVGVPGGDTRNFVQDTGENLFRRTLYSFWKRMAPPPNLEAFNAPSREVCTVRRERTNTPLQALVTLNDPQFIEAARHLAQESLRACESNCDKLRVAELIAQRVLCRPLSARERPIVVASVDDFLAYYQANPNDAKLLIAIGDSERDERFDAPVLAAWTMFCNQMMNLDEVLTK